jgi:hypothetical protein
VEVVSNSDDGVEFFGGTVNTKRIAVAFCHDESFDIDQGHSGFHQFWFSIQNSDPLLGDFGGEWDGGNGDTVNGEPYTLTRIYNMTMLGTGSTAVGSIDDGINLSDNFAGTLANSLIHDFNGVGLSNVGDGVNSPKPNFLSNTWGIFANGGGLVDSIGGVNATDPAGSDNGSAGVDPELRGISRIPDGGLDPRPSATSPLLGATLAAFPMDAPADFFETVDYRGAFGTDESSHWLRGWSYLSQQGYLGADDVQVTENITTNTTWTADNTYILSEPIFITNGATLTIEPGTLILGEEDTVNSTFGSLIVTRDSQLIADGTAEKPIVFTARAERDGIDGDPAIKPDPALGDASYWGGVIMLGNAQVNRFEGGTNTGEAVIEGFPNAGDVSLTTYGGGLTPDNADNSGILRYVSIRFGGFEFAANNEINGLTLGGVGSGTIIENVEVISNSDDGVEFFGGTVNTKRIAVAFCQDESFDIDQGHSGFHQFWFSIQNSNPLLGDFGGEWDGGNGDNVNGEPYTLTRIYNMTMLGTGSTAVGSIDDGINLSDNFAGTLANSLIHDFNGVGLSSQSDGVNDPKPNFLSNTWGIFAGGGGLVANIGGPNATDPAGSDNGAAGVNPLLFGISRIPNRVLDPRPSLTSPLREASLAAFPMDAPMGFFDTVDYRGAFGDSNWLDGWSYLSRFGYLSDGEIPEITDVTPPVITLIGNNPINLTVGDSFTDPGANVTDDFDAPRTITGTGSVNTAVANTYVLTYNTTDEAGNAATTVTRNVIVSAPEIELPESEDFVTSARSPLDIANYFQTAPFDTATVTVVGKLPKGMTFTPGTKLISGYPQGAGTATFLVTLPGEAPVQFVMNFSLEPVPARLLGKHVLHNSDGDEITVTISSKGTAVTIQKPGISLISLKGAILKYNDGADPEEEWTIEVPSSQLSIAFPVEREFKAGDNSYLGNYGTFEGDVMWGFKASTGLGRIVMSKGGVTVTITSAISTKGVAWSVTPTGGKAIKATGSISPDGIASIRATVPGPGLLMGMLRVDEELDDEGVPTGELIVSLLQGFDGWNPVSYTP